MTILEVRNRLIDKIRNSENNKLLEEAYRLFELEDEDLCEYQLSDDQIQAINEAREQIRTGDYLTSDQADNAIDEWLEK